MTDTQSTQTETTQTQEPEVQQTTTEVPVFSWKSQLSPDFANSPTMQKYSDTKEGLTDAVKSHLELQKMMGHEKVPIPKGPDDVAAMSLFKKALRIPDKADGYSLGDISLPDNMKDFKFDKTKFAEALLKVNATPEQAKGLWGAYGEMVKQQYTQALQEHQEQLTNAINVLRGEWGDAYQTKVNLGQMVINKFSDNKEMNDAVTALLLKDPAGIKFLSKIGEQFAENKIGDFKYQNYSKTPEELQREIDAIVSDQNHPYNNPKSPQLEHDRAVDYVNTLREALNKTKTR